MDSSWVLAGPLLQPLRGLIFAVALWPLRDALLSMERGWLAIWGLFVGFAILGTAAAAPGSVEGMIYTTLPLRIHWSGSPEIYGQTLAYAWLLFHWERASAVTSDEADTGQALGLASLKALCVVLLGFSGMVIVGVATSAALGVGVDELSGRPGAMAVLLVTCTANFALAFGLGRRQERDRSLAPTASLGLFYLANTGPATDRQIFALRLIDPLLVLAMWGCVAWAFGWRTLCVALVFWGSTYAAPFGWTGGAYLRQGWLASSLIGICLLRRRRHFAAGFLLAVAAFLRVFPAVLLAGLGAKILFEVATPPRGRMLWRRITCCHSPHFA